MADARKVAHELALALGIPAGTARFHQITGCLSEVSADVRRETIAECAKIPVGLAAATVIGIVGHATAATVVGGGSLAVMVVGFLRRSKQPASGEGAK